MKDKVNDETFTKGHPGGKGVSSHRAAHGLIPGQAGCITRCVPLTRLAQKKKKNHHQSMRQTDTTV